MSIDEWVKKMWCTNVILLDHKKNEIMPLVMTWMDFEGVLLSEISQRNPSTTEFQL